MIGDIAPKSMLRPVPRHLLAAGVRRGPDNEAIFQPTFRADRLRSYGNGGEQADSKQKPIHHVPLQWLDLIDGALEHIALTASCSSPAVHFGLRDCTGGDQSSDAGLAQTVTVAAHAILQTSCFKPPLATEPAVIFGTFSLAGHRRAGGEKNYS
jgi:hypothetical protein